MTFDMVKAWGGADVCHAEHMKILGDGSKLYDFPDKSDNVQP